MNVVITGGNGFIGSHLIQSLRYTGAEISVIDRGPPRADFDWSGVTYRKGSFDDVELLDEALRGCDLVFHLASTTVPGTANLDPAADVRGNLLGTMTLVDAMARAACKRILYLSSGGTVYGDSGVGRVCEDSPCRPISSYGIVKYAVERFLLMYQRTGILQPIILRASNPYGSRQGKLGVQGLIGTAISRISSGEALEIWGDGTAVRDYIYITDLIKLMMAAADSPATGVFNAGSGEGYSVLEVLREVSRALEREPMLRFGPGRDFDVKRIVLDIRRAQDCFNWSPTVSLPEGLRATLSHRG